MSNGSIKSMPCGTPSKKAKLKGSPKAALRMKLLSMKMKKGM